ERRMRGPPLTTPRAPSRGHDLGERPPQLEGLGALDLRRPVPVVAGAREVGVKELGPPGRLGPPEPERRRHARLKLVGLVEDDERERATTLPLEERPVV